MSTHRQAYVCFIIIVWSLAAILLLGARDQAGAEQFRAPSRAEQIECVADRVAEGAPTWIALNLCGGPDASGLEVDLP